MALEEVVGAAVRATGRPVSGFLGPLAQVAAARRLGPARAPLLDSPEVLYALALDALRVPAPLAEGRLAWRPPRAEELALLAAWRHDYRVEVIGEAPGAALRARSAEEVARAQADGRHFVLTAGERPVAYAAWNAQTPRCVQIGGVWTPPALRGRGYGRAVVAGALLAARARGIGRSVLFTPETNRPARRAYEALGYERIGDYGMVLFPAAAGPG